jgi:hypothetical protein
MGIFVLVVSEASFVGEATSLHDLFRVETGKSQSTGIPLKPLHRVRNGRTPMVNADHQIAAPEFPLLRGRLARVTERKKRKTVAERRRRFAF